jgi:hypothetical protein
MTKEQNFKLHKNALYGNSVYKILEESSKAITDYIHENYCDNRDVATGNYDCPYATTVLNTICCTGHECNYKGIYNKPVVNNTETNSNYELSLDDSDIVDYPF